MAGSLQTLLSFRTLTAHNELPWLHKPIAQSNRLQSASNPIAYNHTLSLHQNPRSIPKIIRASDGYNQVSDNENQEPRVWNSSKVLTWAEPLLNFAAANFLPIALVSGVALGLVNPSLGCLAQRHSMSKFSTFGIFLISGLMLRTEEIGATAEAWSIGLFGLISILLVTPFLSRIILQLRLAPQEFVTGLAIFSCMPTTLSSGVALTQLVGGNSALALAITVISNLLGIVIVPFSISKFIANGVGVSVPTEQLLRSLLITLLVPLVLGKVFRDCFNGVGEYVDQNRKLFSMISAILLSLVPWIQVSRSRQLLLMVKPEMFLMAVGMGLLLHLILLAFNTFAAQSLSVAFGGKTSVFTRKENFRALVIVASQKTLPVMVAVVEQLHGALGESGLLVLPCVAAHINQIIFDSFLVNLWLRRDQLLQGSGKNQSLGSRYKSRVRGKLCTQGLEFIHPSYSSRSSSGQRWDRGDR